MNFSKLILIVALTASIFSACKKEDTEPSIIGTWKVSNVEAKVETNFDSVSTKLENFIILQNSQYLNALLTFESGNKFTINYLGNTVTSSYGYNNKSLIIGTQSFSASISDNFFKASKFYDNMIDSTFVHDVLNLTDTAVINRLKIAQATCIYTCDRN